VSSGDANRSGAQAGPTKTLPQAEFQPIPPSGGGFAAYRIRAFPSGAPTLEFPLSSRFLLWYGR